MRFEGEDDQQDDELLLTDQVEENEGGEEQDGQEVQAEPEGDDLELSIEGEDDGNETELVRRLRDQVRTAHGRVAELERKTQPAKIEVGDKPTLEGCDWDPDRFESELSAYQDRKRQAESQEREQGAAQEAQNREFERLKARHMQRAAVLKIPDFEAKEQKVIEALGPELVGAALVVADDSAKLVGALGNNPAALAKIQDEPNPLLKLKMLMKLEAKIVVNRKKPPAPEASTIQRGSAPVAVVQGDKEEARLLAAAEKDPAKFSAYRAYMKQKKAKAA